MQTMPAVERLLGRGQRPAVR